MVRSCSLGSVCVTGVKEEAGKHPRDHVNTTHRSRREWRLRNSALPSPWPGSAQVTHVSRLRSIFLTALFCHIREDPGLFYFPWKKLHFLTHVTHTLTQKGKGKEFIHSFLLVHFFPHSFHFRLFFLVFAHCSPSANPQKPNSATKNPLLSFKCPLLLNNSFLLLSHKHIPHFPFFAPLLSIYSSVAH